MCRHLIAVSDATLRGKPRSSIGRAAVSMDQYRLQLIGCIGHPKEKSQDH
ncbi:MAG: hypothetical protein H6822_34575 [Planctomycetaceae bacterium]|nr:hypothetical protein [Planctomycetales bacterium]MCB9927313.1 hypothetical protein [Planctomycetaceae bacterium]